MKIADYNQMMAYLTQQEVPSELPQPKPSELLDLQEQKRKDRLRGLMEELDPVLMDESKDFIEREEFADGSKTAAKKSLLKFLNPDYLKAKGPERSALLSKQRDRLGRLKKGTSAVLKDVDQTENFLKKFYEYSDKFFGGNRSRALTSIIPNYDPANKSILKNMRLRVGLPADEGSLAQRTKIKGLKEGLTFSEFRTKIAKEPDFLKKVTKGANVNKFYNTRDLFNLLGITTERGNPKAIEYFTGELKRAGIESRPNPAGGLGKQYKLKNVINFFKEKPKTMLGKTSAERNLERLRSLTKLDKSLVDFNREVIRNVRETAVAEDVYIPKNILGASAGDHIGHPVSVKVTNKPEFKNLLKDSNVNKMNSLVFQDAVVNMEALNKKTGYDTKFNTYFKQLNKFLNKPITEKNRAELIKIKNDMDNHYVKAVNTVNKLAEQNEFFKGQQKRIPKVTINIPEVGSKFKSSDLFADMSTVDSEYRYGKVQDINPNARFFKDLSDDQKQIFKQNIYNQYSDNLNSFYKAAKIPVQDVEEFSEFIEAGGVKETVGTRDVIPTDIGKSKGVTLGANLVTADDAKRLVDFSKIPQDLRNVSDEIIKPLAEKAVLYGPEYAKQLIQMSKPVAKFALAESTLGLGFAPFDIGEGRTMKEVALNVATLGTGVPVKDAMDIAAYADKFGLKEALFTAKMKQSGQGKDRGYGSEEDFALTDDEQEALKIEEQYKTEILQPRLDALLEERQTESDPMFGLTALAMANGGRIGFADGPDNPRRRNFIKLMTGIMSLPFVGRILKPFAEPVQQLAPVVSEGAKLGFDNFMKLVAKIKAMGTKTKNITTQERQDGYKYTGKDGSEYEMVEDLSTGDIRITKDKIGSGSYGDKTFDTLENKSTFELKVNQADETTKGKKPPNEYDEGQAVFDQDGTVADFEEIDDNVIKAIEDEIN